MAYTPTLADLNQLDQSPSSQGYQPTVSDLNALDQQHGNSTTVSGGFLRNLLPNYGNYAINTTLGFGDALQNALAKTANLIPGVNLPLAKTGSGTAYDIGNIAGNIGGFLGGGEALDAARAAAEGLPVVGQSAQALGGSNFLPSLMRHAIGSGAYGAVMTPQNRALGATVGAATSGLGDVTLGALSGAPNLLKDYLSRYASQGLTKNVGQAMQGAQKVNNAQAFSMAQQNYQAMTKQEQAAWDGLKQQASSIDQSMQVAKPYYPVSDFNNSSYIAALQNKLQDLGQQASTQSAYGRANTDSMQLIQDYMNDKHDTFADAIQHNQALNQDYQNEITPGKSLPFNTINYAKGAIKNTITNNINDLGLQDTLGSAWNNANAITAQKNQIFNEVAGSKGKANISTFATINNLKNPNADPTTFVNDYLPTRKGDGTQKMQQFAQMLGDENTAKQVLKSNYFDPAIESHGVNPQKFITKYNNLSTDQQNYLFSPQENQTIQALNRIKETHPDALSHSAFTSLGHHGISATLGGILGLATGNGLLEGLGAGIVGGVAATSGLRKLFERPGISSYFTNYLTKPSAAPIGQSMFGQAVNAGLPPTAVNLVGGQNGY